MEEKQEVVYLGVVELAAFIGWHKAKTHTYYRRGVIEKPAAYVGTRPLWTLEQAERIKKLNT